MIIETKDYPALSLADLEAFDPYSGERGQEKATRRFCCPFCGDRYLDKSHRSLALETATGLWCCHRCNKGGKLTEHWTSKHDLGAVHRAIAGAPTSTSAAATEQEWPTHLANAVSIEGTPGADYLARRGIPLDLAKQAGVLYSPSFYGRAAVLCLVTNRDGGAVALTGRHTDTGEPRMHSAGPKSAGVFATPGAFDTPTIVVTEAPLDALSLAACGVPALAFIGTTGPAWLPGLCVFRHVALAFDADEAGDKAADALRPVLESFGAKVERWRPEGGKDWNDLLRDSSLSRQLFDLGVDPPGVTQVAQIVEEAPAPAVPLDANPLPYCYLCREHVAAPCDRAMPTAEPALTPCGRFTWRLIVPPTVCRACKGTDFWRLAPEVGGGWCCARCHPQPATAPGANVRKPLPEAADLATWAQAEGCPRLPLAPHVAIAAGEAAWHAWLGRASAADLAEAWQRTS